MTIVTYVMIINLFKIYHLDFYFIISLVRLCIFYQYSSDYGYDDSGGSYNNNNRADHYVVGIIVTITNVVIISVYTVIIIPANVTSIFTLFNIYFIDLDTV